MYKPRVIGFKKSVNVYVLTEEGQMKAKELESDDNKISIKEMG